MNHFTRRLTCVIVPALLALPGCGGKENTTPKGPPTVVRAERTHALTLSREGFTTTLRASQFESEPVPEPPQKLFRLVRYESPVGSLAAYLTPDPQDGKKHPAIVWITGGDCNSIGEVWDEAPEENDQTASAYRKAGIIMMFPSLRGGNDNPGIREGFLGEVEDVLAAAEYLGQQPFVDSQRIYLGGHSTGGTLVLLVAECSSRFRAVFSFGPVDDVSGYGDQFLPFNSSTPKEAELRSPGRWLDWIGCRTYVFEGTGYGNIESLQAMKESTSNKWIQFHALPGADHFNILAPTNRLIAQKILRDKGPVCDLAITEQELRRPFASQGVLGVSQ